MEGTYIEILEKQLACDYDCTIEDVRSDRNIFRTQKICDGARSIGSDCSMLKVAIYREKLLVMADEKILDWCKNTFGRYDGVWFSEPENLISIHNKLQEYGQRLADTHHYYIPTQNYGQLVCVATKSRNVIVANGFERKEVELKWYEKAEIETFRGDDRFHEAILFDEKTPDMLAVCAVDSDVILGMAGATKDTNFMWQIGVNVTQEGRGKGIGSMVVACLKDEVLSRGFLPFYATVESHIKSQKVAIRAGFEPVFYEMFSE